MLPYDTDPEQQLTIEALARARYDGDIDAAYREVLETGLDHTAIPARRPLDSADGTLGQSSGQFQGRVREWLHR